MDRRNFLSAVGVGSLGLGLSVSSAQAQETPSPATSALPISESSRRILNDWVAKIRAAGPQNGPNPDPEYSEFWVELRPVEPPADPPDPGDPDPAERIKIGDLLRSRNPLSTRFNLRGTPSRSLDLRNYVADLTNRGTLNVSNWSEEVWTEITPEWAEMYPEPPAKPKNAVLTVSARRSGYLVPKGYFVDLLREVARASP